MTGRRAASLTTDRWPSARRGTGVAIVTVNYNTRDYIALLLWSISRTVRESLHSLIVVDNGSTDGSVELLTGCADAGLCTLIANDTNRYHGPALNQALSHLATVACEPMSEPARWVWVIDSDCVVVKPETLSAATSAASAQHAALLGERRWDPWHRCDRLAAHSLLLDPEQVWQPNIARFEPGGDPSYELERSCLEAGVPVLAFPFVSEGYVIHRGRSTLDGVRERRETANGLYEWATTHHEPHFELVPGARQTYARLVEAFHQAVPVVDAASLVEASQPPGW
jgi:hypothetical protein